jgi:hypothetical protein
MLRLIPDVNIDDVLPLTLKEIERSARKQILDDIGSASEYFCRLARASRSTTGEFVGEGPVNASAAVSLLSVIQEEEAVTFAFSAALFCLSKLKDNSSELLQFLAPLLEEPQPVRDNVVSFGGIEMADRDYGKLKGLFDQITCQRLIDRLVDLRIIEFVDLAEWARIAIGSFLREHADVSQEPFDEVVSQLRALAATGLLPDALRQGLEQANWDISIQSPSEWQTY